MSAKLGCGCPETERYYRCRVCGMTRCQAHRAFRHICRPPAASAPVGAAR